MTNERLSVPLAADCKIVVVDDEVFSRFMTVELLERLGATGVQTAPDGYEALAQLSRDDIPAPDLIFLDLEMPGVSGIDVLKEIRSGHTKAPHDVPVVFLTAHDELGLLLAAFMLDVDAFLKKPMDMEMLSETVRDIGLSERHIQPADYYQEVNCQGIQVDKMNDHFNSDAVENLAAADLVPGMIIAEDVYTTEALVVGAGSMVTPRMARLLKGVAAHTDLKCFKVVRNHQGR